MSDKDKPAHSPISKDDASSLSLGRIEISDQVIAAIAAKAASKVEGVAVIGSSFRWTELLGSKEISSKSGVSVKTDQESGHVEIDVDINVEYGITIYNAAHDLQQLIKEEVEAMTGAMNVDKVNVRVRQMIEHNELEEEPMAPDQAVNSQGYMNEENEK